MVDGPQVVNLPVASPATSPPNGSAWADWKAAWCDTCVNDINEDCPIILSGMLLDQPPEWRRGPLWSPQTAQYCVSYESR